MRTTILLFFAITQTTWALPVVNENVANCGVMTIYPDHKDPHRFYIAPNIVMIARNNADVPYFSYVEYRSGLIDRTGIMQMTLVPSYTRNELETAKAEILKKDSSAKFSGVPFLQSNLELTGSLPEMISGNQCDHIGGLIGQEQACSLVLTSKGRKLFYHALTNKTIFTTLQFSYTIQAVILTADGHYLDQTINHGIAVRIDGEQLSMYPELIQRQ